MHCDTQGGASAMAAIAKCISLRLKKISVEIDAATCLDRSHRSKKKAA